MTETLTGLSVIVELGYLLSAVLFVFGLKRMSSPVTARQGNALAAFAMLLAVVLTLADQGVLNWQLILTGLLVGALIGALAARLVKMTAMPQMVGLFNGLGGSASAVVGTAEFLRLVAAGEVPTNVHLTILLSVLIGWVTFSGSLIAFAKLQGVLTGAPITYPLQNTLNALLFLGILGLGGYVLALGPNEPAFWVIGVLSFVLGILLVIPIGGADMPVVISLLNSYSGLAASMAGFVINNMVLIISGSLVGAAGLILTNLMCKAMNRSLANVAFGAFGTGEVKAGAVGPAGATVREVSADDAAAMLAYARKVVVVPGYGLAVAQAQHQMRELADQLEKRGVEVKFAIHPVAGRMPGHMNVLLAEADVPYTKLYDLDEINPEFEHTDVVLVIGANDVVNPAARRPDSLIAGMPILDVDRAKTIIFMKRSLRPGFAGIDNELFYNPKTYMLFGDAKDMAIELVKAVRQAA